MLTLTVTIPNNNISEREYIIDILLSKCIGLSYRLIPLNRSDIYSIEFDNKKIIIKDAFFNDFPIDLSYLKAENIPQEVKYFDSPFPHGNIPIIYGENQLECKDDFIYCGLDIFASSFFMLTRWEELFIKKDKHGRPDEDRMFVVKHDISKLPVVNMYALLLQALLQQINIEIPKKRRKFTPFITHDVDNLFRYASFKNFTRNLFGDIAHRKSIKILYATLRGYIKYKQGKMKDPFDTFDGLMDLSDKYGLKNSFYFIPSLKNEFDARYDIFDPKMKTIIKNIIQRGHEVGIHPSKNTFHNEKQFMVEYDRLKTLHRNIHGGRQHYLLYDIKSTFHNWNSCESIKYDTGLGFYNRIGFRCGFCYEFPIFDLYGRETLQLLERPLLVMETSCVSNHIEPGEMYKEIIDLIDMTHAYNGNFVLLWHNDNFNRHETLKYKNTYKQVIQYIHNIMSQDENG